MLIPRALPNWREAVLHRPERIVEWAQRETSNGQLDVFYDLIPEVSSGLGHRYAAVPTRVAPALAPIVQAMQRHEYVGELLREAVTLLPFGAASEEEVRASTLEVVRVAALKGLIRLVPSRVAV